MKNLESQARQSQAGERPIEGKAVDEPGDVYLRFPEKLQRKESIKITTVPAKYKNICLESNFLSGSSSNKKSKLVYIQQAPS